MDFFQIMGEFFADWWAMMTGGIGGSFHFVLIAQAVIAAILGIRAGRADARHGYPPYLSSIFSSDAEDRWALVREGWGEIRTLFIIVVVLDVAYEIIVLHWVYPVQALIMGVLYALIPYLILRGLTNRLSRNN